jgi:hypothetical protein
MSQPDPLHLAQRNLVLCPIVKLGRTRRLMASHPTLKGYFYTDLGGTQRCAVWIAARTQGASDDREAVGFSTLLEPILPSATKCARRKRDQAGRASGRKRRHAEHLNDNLHVGIGAYRRCLRYLPPPLHPIHRVVAASLSRKRLLGVNCGR